MLKNEDKSTDDKITQECNRFKDFYKRIVDNSENISFIRYIEELIEQKNITSGNEFAEKTRLNPGTYSKICLYYTNNLEFHTVLSICVGLDCNIEQTELALKKAGYTFRADSREHHAYRYVIEQMPKADFDERNMVLEKLNVRKLGSHYYSKSESSKCKNK